MKHEALFRRCLSVTQEGVVNGMDRQQFIEFMVDKHGERIDNVVDQALSQGIPEQKIEELIASVFSIINIATE